MTHGQRLRHDSTSLNLLGQAMVHMLQHVLPKMEERSRNLAGHFIRLAEQGKAQQALINSLMEHCRIHVDAVALAQLEQQASAVAKGAEADEPAISDMATEMQFHGRHNQEMENICTVLHIYGYLLEQEGKHLPALVDVVWLEAVERSLLSAIRLNDLRHALLDAARQVGLPFPEIVPAKAELNKDATATIELF